MTQSIEYESKLKRVSSSDAVPKSGNRRSVRARYKSKHLTTNPGVVI